METIENETGGETIVLRAGDQLDQVAEPHATLVTPQVEAMFRDPNAYLRNIANRCPFEEMSAWLLEATDTKAWRLELDLHGYDPDLSFAGFYWPGMKWYARLSPPKEDLPDWLTETMATYYSLIGELDTNGFGVAGGFKSVDDLILLGAYLGEDEEVNVDPEEAVVWGDSSCGDLMVFTSAGEAGWFDHGARRFESIGSEADAINWIFARLRRGEPPYPDSI